MDAASGASEQADGKEKGYDAVEAEAGAAEGQQTMSLDETLEEMAAWALLDDTDLLTLIASYAYCYAVYREEPRELQQAFQVAEARGLLDLSL